MILIGYYIKLGYLCLIFDFLHLKSVFVVIISHIIINKIEIKGMEIMKTLITHIAVDAGLTIILRIMSSVVVSPLELEVSITNV